MFDYYTPEKVAKREALRKEYERLENIKQGNHRWGEEKPKPKTLIEKLDDLLKPDKKKKKKKFHDENKNRY
jgi:hypothetical protein